MTGRMFLGLVCMLGSMACAPGEENAAVGDIGPDAVLALVAEADGPLLLDVRTPGEFAEGHVPGAVNIPHSELAVRLDELEAWRGRGAVVYCERGGRAGLAGDVLLDAGFARVLHMEGDMSGWRAEGRESER